MNVISYSLYGDSEKYLKGILENATTCKKLLPNWQVRVYCGLEIPKEVICELEILGCHVYLEEEFWHKNGMFWRYLPLGEEGIDYLIFRDADSRITMRDIQALNEWVESGKIVHFVRDHPFHQAPILGGLWGIKNSKIETTNFWKLAKDYSSRFGEDQRFLANHVYPYTRKHSFSHDHYFAYEKKCRNLVNQSENYMGESFDENDNIDIKLREIKSLVDKSPRARLVLKVRSFIQSKFLLCKSYFVSKRALTIPKR